jgi:uncharacterized protein YgiM (DUF1202 family)
VTINVVDSASLPSSSTATPTTGAGSGGPAPTTQSSGPTNTLAPTNTLSPTQPAATSTPDVPTARFTGGINVRSGPGTNFNPPIGSFTANETAEILALNTQETWLKVRYGGGEGWVFASLVEIQGSTASLPREVGPPTPVPTAPPAPTAAPTSASSVNITVIEPFISPSQPQCGQQFTVGMTIQNNSTVQTTIGISRIQDVHVASGNVVTSSGDALVAVTLDPGATHRVTFNFTINAFFGELHRIDFIADVNNQVAETNENDNRIGVEYTLPANCP